MWSHHLVFLLSVRCFVLFMWICGFFLFFMVCILADLSSGWFARVCFPFHQGSNEPRAEWASGQTSQGASRSESKPAKCHQPDVTFFCITDICVVFAGIGYFTLPYLVHAGASHVYACEWNPHAVEALQRNLHLNSVFDRCTVLFGDNRQASTAVFFPWGWES